MIGEGLTNRQIAERMFLAEKTVKNYVSSLLTKLGMQRRTRRRPSPCGMPMTRTDDPRISHRRMIAACVVSVLASR